MTLRTWVQQTNAISGVLLAIAAIVCTVVSRDNDPVYIQYIVNSTNIRQHRFPFRVGWMMAIAVGLESFSQIRTSIFPGNLVNHLADGKTSFGNANTMVLTLPMLHAAALVGIAKVYDVFAVFSMISVVLLALVSMSSRGSIDPSKANGLTLVVSIAMYATAWGLAWMVGSHASPIAVVCYTVTLVCYVGALAYLSYRKHNGSNAREHAMVQAAFKLSSGLGVYLMTVSIWAGSSGAATFISPWIAFCVVGFVFCCYCMFVAARMPTTAGALNAQLITQDTIAPTSVARLNDAESSSDEEPYRAAHL